MSYARHVRVLIPLLPYLARDNASRYPAGKGLPVMQPVFLPLINVELLPVERNYKNDVHREYNSRRKKYFSSSNLSIICAKGQIKFSNWIMICFFIIYMWKI